MKTRFRMVLLLVLMGFLTNVLAQDLSIPDPGLNGAIRETLAKPAGPLTAEDLLSLTSLDVSRRGVSSLEGLGAAHNLITLNLEGNELTSLTLPAGLTNLTELNLYGNQLTNLILPAGLTNLTTLNLDGNRMTSLTLPAGLTSLKGLGLGGNQLTDFSFLSGLTNLTALNLNDNQLTTFTLPADLTNLTRLFLQGNQLTSLTLPASLTSLTDLYLSGNPLLKTFVVSEQLAATGLAAELASLRGRGISVYTYPVAVSLVSAQRTMAEAFEFMLTGPPGAYTILGSADLAIWSELGTLNNLLGRSVFIDLTVTNSLQNFYRARSAP